MTAALQALAERLEKARDMERAIAALLWRALWLAETDAIVRARIAEEAE